MGEEKSLERILKEIAEKLKRQEDSTKRRKTISETPIKRIPKTEPVKPEPTYTNIPTENGKRLFRQLAYVVLFGAIAYIGVGVYQSTRHEEKPVIVKSEPTPYRIERKVATPQPTYSPTPVITQTPRVVYGYRPTSTPAPSPTPHEKTIPDVMAEMSKKLVNDVFVNDKKQTSTSQKQSLRKEVVVYAKTPDWTDTKVYVNKDDKIEIYASGSVVHWVSPNKRSSQSCGPEGVDGATNGSEFLAPGLKRNSLVGIIGYYAFNVGEYKHIASPTSDYLYLGMNDTVHDRGCTDNSGQWDIVVYVNKK